ncbi:MAG: NUDIX domain-containing protein [Patescibacteria group bacterium]|nr:NUDIX domain-containing protein [Patescibacteria group bacterium]MDD5164864.1 NUDIX domain-containing protein [Patescibacteria group bacterium]MDD5534935.1 NUDIX domain-containing protein [Patescibacteria group bacterium]
MTLQNKVKDNEGSVMKGGGIVAKKEDGKIYILMLYRGNHEDWSFPKGHTEHGETVQQTVIREVEEEGEIKSEIIKEITPFKYFNTNSNEEIICYMYLLRPISGEIKPEYKGDKVEWVPLAEVGKRISYANLRDYFNKIVGEVVDLI